MAFLRQLQLLLWKNGLGTIRRPVWSITLILWPIIIFIIIAVTRHQFPPVLRQTCYVGPRNLPSTGFFPFLETLLCNSDSNCQNTSQSAHPHRNKRSTEESPDFPLSKIIGELRQFANLENTDHDPAVLLNVLSGNFGASSPGLSLGALNETLFGDHPIANSNKSAGRLKSAFCTIAFLFINNTSTTDAGPVIAFCTSNNTVFEVTINTLYKAVRELVMTQQIRPEDLGKLAENILEFFDQLQKEPSLWEFLHVLPQIVNPTSPDQLLGNLKKLFESLQLFLNIIEHKFPEVKANMSSVHPFIEAGVSLTDYMRNWPGKNVKIRLGDVMTSNDSLCQMMGNMEISLDQALALYFDTKMVSDYVCQITYNPVLMAACATGTVEKCLSSTSTNKLLQQTLLKWSTLVAPHDLSLAKGLLHSLMELFGGSRMSRATRSLEEQAQNVEEELFLGVGKVVREILQISPEATAVVNQILQAGFQSMTFATKAMAVLEGGMDSLLKDVTRIKMIVQVLSTDQPQSTSWMIQAFNSVSEMIAKIFAGESLTCDNVLSEFEWLFSIKTIRRELWQSFFCENTTTIEQTLLSDWTPLIENALALYHTLSGHSSYNVTLPMILSEWHGLWNRSERVVQLSQEWGGANWTSWVPANSSSHLLLASLQNSVAVFLGKLGQKIVHEWPEAKSYMYMTDWILHYEPGVTASPNCSMDVATFAIECHGNLNWEKFVNALLRAVMSPNEDLLISCLKGSVQLLQHVYSNFFKYEAASFLHREVEGGHMIAVYLSNMLNQLNEFVFSLTKLPDDANPQHIIPLFQKLLESTGLKPLLPLILSDSPVNISQVLKVASELGRSNQAMFTFNESDPTMAELEKLITQFLSMEGNLSMSLYLGMSNSLLTYSSHFSPEYVAKIKEAIQPFTNQTSSGVVEAILSAVELLEIITDSSNSEPTHVILGYLRLLQDFVASLFQVKMLEQVRLANGQLSPAMVTQLPILSDMLNFLTPEGIMNLTRVGPVAAQQIIIQKYIQTLPPQLRQPAIEFLHDFVDLQTQLVDCESVEDCLSGTSEVLEFVDNILGITLDANGNASINIAGTKTFMGRKEYTPVASALIPLLLKQNDAAHVRSAKEISKLTSILINLQNITVRDVQDALSQTNLTIEELNDFVEQLGALDVNDLLKKINKLLSASKCFEQLTSPALVTQCVGDMVNSVHSFLMHFPAFQNETSILSMIPVIVNKTLQDIMNTNFNRHPQNVIAETLNTALSNVKMALQQNNMSSSEIMNELDVLQRVINLIADPELMKILNISMDELSTGRAPLEIILWCLNRLENVTSISSTSQLLNPIFRVAQMQVALALAQVDLNQYIQQKITNLTENLQYPINEGGVGQIANATIEIMQHMMTFLVFNLETQNAPSYIFDYDAPINMTCVNATVLQINSLLKMLHQANIGSWINPNRTSRTVNDISNLLQATIHMFNIDTQGYIIAIGNITQALTKAVMFAEQPNGLQNDKFLEAILEAIRSATQLLIHQGVPVPLESVQDVARNIAWLIVYPEQSYALTLNTTLNTIHGIRSIIQVLPPEVSFYLHIPLRIADAYFQSVKTASGPDGLNELILNIMFEVQSLLPPNDTAQFYVGTIINITKSILQPSPGNSSLLPMDSTEEIMSYIMTKLLEVWNMLCPVVVGESCSPPSSTQGFADLPMVLEELINGQTNNVTWMKLHHVISNMTQALTKAIMLVGPPNGSQSDQLLSVILEAIRSATQLLIHQGVPVPLESVQDVARNIAWLIVYPEQSYALTLNTTLNTIHGIRSIIQVLPPEVSFYLHIPLRIADAYFQSVKTASGPDGLNELILNIMFEVQSLLPPNDTARFYVGTIINITKSILQPSPENSSAFPMDSAEEMISYIMTKLLEVWNMLCPVVVGESCSPPSSTQGFADLPMVLEELINGQTNNVTWMKLHNVVDTAMTFIVVPELSNNISCLVEMFEKSASEEVREMEALTDLILSLQTPFMKILTEITRSLNGSHFNMSEVSERLEQAVEQTIIMALEKSNGTHNCQEVLKIWDPVREAAGLRPSVMTMWCNISLLSVIEAFGDQSALTNGTCTEMGAMSSRTVAARIVMSIRSLYDSDVAQSEAMEQFTEEFESLLSALVSHPLSQTAKYNLNIQLQALATHNSLQFIELFSDEVDEMFPFLKPYMKGMRKMLKHILTNSSSVEESPAEFFKESSMILLHQFNISSKDFNQIMTGNFSDKAWVDLVIRALQAMINMKVFGDDPMLYHTLDQLLTFNDTREIMWKLADMVSWFTSTEAKGQVLLIQTLTKFQEFIGPLLSVLNMMDIDLPPNLQLIDDLTYNANLFIQNLFRADLLSLSDPFEMRDHALSNHNASRIRRRREVSFVPVSSPMDDFMTLFTMDYRSLWTGLQVPPTASEIQETFLMFFDNSDLSFILKEATKEYDSDLDGISSSEIVDSMLNLAKIFLENDFASLSLWVRAISALPDGHSSISVMKDVAHAIDAESPEIQRLMQETLETVSALFLSDPTELQALQLLQRLEEQVCDLERTNAIGLLEQSFSVEPGVLCQSIVPGVKILVEGLLFNMTSLVHNMAEVFVGDPSLYNLQINWTSMISEILGFNISALGALNMTNSAPVVTVGEMVRNRTAFMRDLQTFGFAPEVADQLSNSTLPDNLQILWWLVNLAGCNSSAQSAVTESEKSMFETFCRLGPEQLYNFTLLMVQHLNTEQFLYRMVLPEEVQRVMGTMTQVALYVMDMVRKLGPNLETWFSSLETFSLSANNEFRQMSRSQRKTISSKATFVTISRALCRNGIVALFAATKNPHFSVSPPPFENIHQRQEMIERFKIPHDATPFCTNMYLDMVNTTGGAIAWAFLKPMLMGKILFTPDTPQTRAVITKANSTLQQFADLKHYSQDWIKSSEYISKSTTILTQTLPLLQNSLSNAFVKNFIEMQTGVSVDSMQETLNNFSNVTVMLEKNKDLVGQINALSTLMVDISSCITFDRYQGYDSEEELNREAQDLAKDRALYASVIFKLPKGSDSRKRRSVSSSTPLPPRMHYTIRMHMDNVMRTDRVRNPFFSKETHISARQTLRYNRGFIYLQESIDRAIIEIQANKTVTDTAVQIQPFPYPCHKRDEFLEAISFVFPLLLMIAWVLFVADFVKKLVHEREMKLHEYMKMMGVNPLSHFFAWFLESAFHLVITIFFLTLVLKYGDILPKSDGFLLFLYLCDYGLSILAFSFLVSTFFDQTYIASLSGSLLYVLSFFPFIVVMAMETHFSFSVKSLLGLFSPTAFSYASQYVSRYEAQGEGIQWSNSYSSPIAGDTASFGWLCWLMLIDTFLYLIIAAYIRTVFPGQSGIPSPWYFPFTASFWKSLCGCKKSKGAGRGLFLTNIMQTQLPAFPDSDENGKDKGDLSSKRGENFSDLPVGVALHGLTKIYGRQAAIENLNVAFYEGHVTSLLGHNGAGKTTTMSILTGLFPPSSGSVEVYGRDMQANLAEVRTELGVCMQYDVLFDHMTAKEHLLLYGQIKAPHWTKGELKEQVRTILEETDMYAHRHKRVGTLSGGMKRKLSISIAFIGGSRLVVLDEPTTGVDPCSRRSIWDVVIKHKKGRTIIMSTHHLDEAEVLSDRIAFLERGGLKCCGSPFYLKEQLGQGYKLTLTKKMQAGESEQIDNAELKAFVQAHVPAARLKEAQGSDLVYLLPPFSSNNASSYRSLLTALDSNLDALQLGGYGISDTTLEEVFLHLTHDSLDSDALCTVSETVSDTESINSYPDSEESSYGDTAGFTGTPTVSGVKLAWQQFTAILIKRFHHSRRDWKGLIAQLLLPVLFVAFAMGLGSIRSDLKHYPSLELSPALYSIGPSYSFFSDRKSKLADALMSFPGLDNTCLENSNDHICPRSTGAWSGENGTKPFSTCKCVQEKEVCGSSGYVPPHKQLSSSQIVYNLTDLDVENYIVATSNDFIRNRYGGFDFGLPLPSNLRMDVNTVPENRTLSKVWFNPEGHHTMPAYLNSINNLLLRSNLPEDKDPSQYSISVSSHPYFGRPDDEDSIVQGMLQIMVALCILAGYSITTASFAIYEVSELHSGSKRLQHIAGVSEPFYWAVNFFYDMVVYMIPVVLTVGVIAAFQVPAFNERQNLGAVTLLLVLFGFSTFPWMYLLSSVFKTAEMAFISYVCINLFLSVNTIIPTSILFFMRQITQQNAEGMKLLFDRLSNAFLIFPQFNFGNGLLELARMNIEVQLLSGYGIDAYKNPFSTEALGWMMIASFIQGLFFFALRLLWNKTIVRKVRSLIVKGRTVPLPWVDEDEDVAAEHLRVSSGAASADVLQVNQLTKVYQHLNKKVPAVKKLSLGVPAGECFGLLGVNGAGKTTTFKMLTGDVSPTEGTAQIRDRDGRLVDIMECRNQGVNIGYCPQVDALDGLMSGEEHLYFYARLHGISKRDTPGVVNYLLRRLELDRYRDTVCDSYSCGTRRKLSTALALVGHPQILLLDEPSSGMDPRTKRHLWKIITAEVKGKCAVVLTSHSMEECEALCGRLAVMVQGQFRCLGSLQHIKNRFGSGFTVRMYLAKASCDAEAITRFMQSRFPSTYLKDQHSAMVEYHVPVAPGGVADIFGQLESSKEHLEIQHFSVSQTTLDEVFINFAMGKIGMETVHMEEDDEFGDDYSLKGVDA